MPVHAGEGRGCIDEPRNLFRAEDDGQAERNLGKRDMLQHVGSLERLDE